MPFEQVETSTTEVALLRCDNCGEGFQWPTDCYVPQYCPLCGKQQ